jgi:toxin ParE1/3/4
MTAREVAFHPFADADLEAIYFFIAKDSPRRAIAFVRQIRRFCETLKSMPLRGRSRGDLVEGVRTIVFKRRVIVAYRVKPSEILILRLFYAGQNIDSADWPA